MEERHMYPIIKARLESMGFSVRAEVDYIDIMAVKYNKTLLIEMKKVLSISLIYQGIERQKLSDYVYLAIPKPSEKHLNSKTFKEKKAIIKRLGLGLLIVDNDLNLVTFLVDPSLPNILKDTKTRRKMEKEFLLRKTALNEGGVTRTKIITAYRELALKILMYLDNEEKPLKDIVKYTGEMKTTRILIDNHYGWFERVKRGVYTISDKGKKALVEYRDVIEALDND